MSVALVTLLALVGAPATEAPATVHRYAVLAAASHGGPDRAVLRYASKDAQAVSRVLDDLGGVPLAHQTRLEDPDRAGLLAAIRNLEPEITAHRGARVELFLYYSGHSDEEGLLLGEERLPYRELREALGVSGALEARGVKASDVRDLAATAMRDACLVTNPRRPTPRDLEVVLELAL
ncbi:MAG: hypothetical protein KC933_19685 [Myxococcales bacterium]|nr:hypothetical protein [Myxococcales bacterium]